jgi:hypothetical protein
VKDGKYVRAAGERGRARCQQVVTDGTGRSGGRRRPRHGAGSAQVQPGAAGVLALNNVEVLYSDVILALKGVSMQGAAARPA